jgi:hypothetical protein
LKKNRSTTALNRVSPASADQMSPNRPKTRIAIVGGGISGIAQGIRIKEAVGDRVELTVSDLAGEWTESASADRVNFGFPSV